MFLFGFGMLIYISFNLYVHVLHGISNSSQDKYISQRGAALQMVIL